MRIDASRRIAAWALAAWMSLGAIAAPLGRSWAGEAGGLPARPATARPADVGAGTAAGVAATRPGAGAAAGAREEQGTDEAALAAIVAELASPAMEGRGVKTRGLALARDRIVGWFTQAGLEPGAGKTGYLQDFEVALGVEVAKQSCAIAADGLAALEGRAETDFNALGFSADGAFEGELVLAGYGIDAPESGYDSYRGLERGALRGKVAVAFRYEPMNERGHSRWAGRNAGEAQGPWTQRADLIAKARAASRYGASALLIVDPPGQRGATLKPTAYSEGPTAAIPVLHISTAWLEGAISKRGGDGATALREFQRRADEGDGPVMGDGAPGRGGVAGLEGLAVRGEVELRRPRTRLANVIGVLPGAGALADRVIVLGAHYDHLGHGERGTRASSKELPATHPGADDNASGVAALVLLARRLTMEARGGAAGSAAGDGERASRGRRTLVFVAFSGEEQGLLGSKQMVGRLGEVGLEGRIEAMLNFDMIGRMRERRLYILGVGTGDGWKALARRANAGLDVVANGRGAARAGAAIASTSAAGADGRLDLNWRWDGPGMSDDASFTPAGIPAVSFFTGLHDDYHRPSDTAEKINADGAEEIISLAQRMVREMWAAEKRVAWKKE